MQNKKYDAVVVGAAGIDTNIYLHGDEINFEVEANFSQNRDYVGQAGGYSARLFAQLGKKTAFIGAVGDDFTGRFVNEELQSDGIDTDGIFIDSQGTKRSINFMYNNGQRKNFYDGKGSMEIKPDIDKARKIFSQSKLAHFSIVDWARHLLPIAKEEGVIISCDLQDIVRVDDEYRQDFIDYADVLFFSAVNFPDPSSMIEHFLFNHPDRIVICGRGVGGCVLGISVKETTPDGREIINTRSDIQFFPIPKMDTPVIDTNGAGDSLAAGFLTSYFIDGYSPEASILRAQIVARHTCSIKASTSEFIGMEELNEWFAKLKQ